MKSREIINIILFVLIFSFSVTPCISQNSNQGVVLKFNKKCNGNVSSINSENQKVFGFIIENLITESQLNAFTEKFIKHPMLVSYYISDLQGDNIQRFATVILQPEAKINDLQVILSMAEIENIILDGKLIPVNELSKTAEPPLNK